MYISKYDADLLPQKEWIVKVYRRQKDGKWQRVRCKNAKGSFVDLRAAVREEAVVIPRAKARVLLTPSGHIHSGTPSQPKKESTPEATLATEIKCRHRTIVISTVGNLQRTIALVFRSEKERIALFDQIVLRNPSLLQMRGEKKPSSENRHQGTVPSQARDNVLQYIFRLCNDVSFSNFTQEVEQSLLSTIEGERMLEALSVSKEIKHKDTPEKEQQHKKSK